MSKTRAYFVIAGFDCPPEEITRELRLKPDGSAAAGEVQKNQSGREFRVKDGYWEIYSTLSQSYELADFIEDLVAKIKPASQQFASVKDILGEQGLFKIVVAVSLETGRTRPGMYLRPHIMKFLGNHEIALEIDVN